MLKSGLYVVPIFFVLNVFLITSQCIVENDFSCAKQQKKKLLINICFHILMLTYFSMSVIFLGLIKGVLPLIDCTRNTQMNNLDISKTFVITTKKKMLANFI